MFLVFLACMDRHHVMVETLGISKPNTTFMAFQLLVVTSSKMNLERSSVLTNFSTDLASARLFIMNDFLAKLDILMILVVIAANIASVLFREMFEGDVTLQILRGSELSGTESAGNSVPKTVHPLHVPPPVFLRLKHLFSTLIPAQLT